MICLGLCGRCLLQKASEEMNLPMNSPRGADFALYGWLRALLVCTVFECMVQTCLSGPYIAPHRQKREELEFATDQHYSLTHKMLEMLVSLSTSP